MKARQFFISTLKEAPADADIVSQQLMIRAGMIKKLAAGVYTYMPMGLRVIRKIENIVREEMVPPSSANYPMPIVQPAELWVESGRWEKYGPELLRFKDRHQRDFVIQPTSEEVITDIARQEITSWRQLPVNLFQIQTKFRDERRPTKRCLTPTAVFSTARVSCSVRSRLTRVPSAATARMNSR